MSLRCNLSSKHTFALPRIQIPSGFSCSPFTIRALHSHIHCNLSSIGATFSIAQPRIQILSEYAGFLWFQHYWPTRI